MNGRDQQAEYVGLRYETKKMIVSYLFSLVSLLHVCAIFSRLEDYGCRNKFDE